MLETVAVSFRYNSPKVPNPQLCFETLTVRWEDIHGCRGRGNKVREQIFETEVFLILVSVELI